MAAFVSSERRQPTLKRPSWHALGMSVDVPKAAYSESPPSVTQIVERRERVHNQSAAGLLLHNVIKRQPDQHLYMNQDDRPWKCLSLC